MADDFRTAFNSIPPVTRTLVFTIGGATLGCLGGILSYQRILSVDSLPRALLAGSSSPPNATRV